MTVEVVRVGPGKTEVGIRTGAVGVTEITSSETILDMIQARLAEKLEKPATAKGETPAIKPEEPEKAPPTVPGGKTARKKEGRTSPGGIAKRPLPESTIFFDQGSNELLTSEIAKLDKIVETLLSRPELKVVLNGYTDASGSADYNRMISESRASTVKMYFAGKEVNPTRMTMRLFMRRDPLGHNVSLLVVMPRDTFDAELRDRLQDLFAQRFGGSSVEHHLSLGESQLAQLHFTVHAGLGEAPEVPFTELEQAVLDVARTWEDRLRDRLVELLGERRGAGLASRWAPRFPDTYKATTQIEVATADVLRFEEHEEGDEAFVVALVNETHDHHTLTRVRLYKVVAIALARLARKN